MPVEIVEVESRSRVSEAVEDSRNVGSGELNVILRGKPEQFAHPAHGLRDSCRELQEGQYSVRVIGQNSDPLIAKAIPPVAEGCDGSVQLLQIDVPVLVDLSPFPEECLTGEEAGGTVSAAVADDVNLLGPTTVERGRSIELTEEPHPPP